MLQGKGDRLHKTQDRKISSEIRQPRKTSPFYSGGCTAVPRPKIFARAGLLWRIQVAQVSCPANSKGSNAAVMQIAWYKHRAEVGYGRFRPDALAMLAMSAGSVRPAAPQPQEVKPSSNQSTMIHVQMWQLHEAC